MYYNKDLFGKQIHMGGSFKESDKPYIIASISSGRSSAMMAHILETESCYDKYEKIYVMANTGRESDKSIKYLKDLQDHVIKKKIYVIEAKVYHDEFKGSGYTLKSFDNLSMKGEPFEEVIKKYGLPSVEFIHCSRELKINPINAFIREYLKLDKSQYRQAIGMRFDELRRVNQDFDNFIYPLCDWGITKKRVNYFWSHGPFKQFDLGTGFDDGFDDFEGNCDLCFKKAWWKLLANAKKNPDRVGWWKDMQDKYDNGYPIYRDHKTVDDIISGVSHSNDDIACLCGLSDDLFFKPGELFYNETNK